MKHMRNGQEVCESSTAVTTLQNEMVGKLGTSRTTLASLVGSSTETTKTLASALSNFNYLLFTLDTGGATDTISASQLIPREFFETGKKVVLAYPTSGSYITATITYVSNTQVKFKVSDAYRGAYLYGIK